MAPFTRYSIFSHPSSFASTLPPGSTLTRERAQIPPLFSIILPNFHKNSLCELVEGLLPLFLIFYSITLILLECFAFLIFDS